MSVAVSLIISPVAPAHGQVITATYVVTGNTGTPAGTVTVTGKAVVGSVSYPVTGTLTLAGTPALSQSFATPFCTGLTFLPTAHPAVFTAQVP